MKSFEMSNRQLATSIEKGHTNLNTPYQRGMTWARKQKSLHIAFILEQSRKDQFNLRTLPMIFNRIEAQTGESFILDSIDGKQRGHNIQSFRANEFKLTSEGCPYLLFMSNDLYQIAHEMKLMYPDRAPFVDAQTFKPLDTNTVLRDFGYPPMEDPSSVSIPSIPSIGDNSDSPSAPTLEELEEKTASSKFSKTAVVNIRGLSYKDLCPVLKNRFDVYPTTIWTTEIHDDWVVARYFQCVNSGSPLTSSEVLKAASASRSFINEVSNNPEYFTGKSGVAMVEQIAMVLDSDSPAFDKTTMARFLALPFSKELKTRIIKCLDYILKIRKALSQNKEKELLKILNKRTHQIILCYLVDKNKLYDNDSSLPKMIAWMQSFFAPENDSKEKERYNRAVLDGPGKMTSLLARIEILTTDFDNFEYTPVQLPTGDESLD